MPTSNSAALVLNTFHATGVSRRQVEKFTKVSKMSTFWNLVTVFGITMRNTFK